MFEFLGRKELESEANRQLHFFDFFSFLPFFYFVLVNVSPLS